MRTELARRSEVAPRSLPGYVLNLRPVQVIVRAARYVMTWALALRILALLFGLYGLAFMVLTVLVARE